jgi:hypothetical protein
MSNEYQTSNAKIFLASDIQIFLIEGERFDMKGIRGKETRDGDARRKNPGRLG